MVYGANPKADKIRIDVTNFNNNLSAADDDLQKALETIDDLNLGATELNGLTDVTLTSPAQYEFMQYDGSKWVNVSNLGDITVKTITFDGTSNNTLQADSGNIILKMYNLLSSPHFDFYYASATKFSIGQGLGGGQITDGALLNGIPLWLNTGASVDGKIYGSTGNSGNLVLSSSSLTAPAASTLGNIYLGSAKTSYFDETNEDLVITGEIQGALLNLVQGSAPSPTTDNLYNVSGDLYWNGNAVIQDLSGYVTLDQTTPQTIINGLLSYESTHSAFTDEHQIVDKEYVDTAVTAINVSYYAYDTSSGISDYKLTNLTASPDAEASVTGASLADTDYIQGWISPTGTSPSVMVAGVYNFHIHAEKTSGTKTLKLYWEMYEYKADTSEVLIGTSIISDEVTSKDEFILHLYLADNYEVTAGSRIVGKVRASVSGAGTAPTGVLYYRGDTLSGWDVPSNTEVLTGIFVPYTGATSNVDLGAYSFSVNSIEIVGSDGEVNKAAVEDSGNWDSAYSHISSDGSDHTFIDQSVISGASPTFDGTNFSGIPAATALSGAVPIANGGSGQTTQQAAIDALTNVSSATDEYVLTKDTATGNAVFKAPPSASPYGNDTEIQYNDGGSFGSVSSFTFSKSVSAPALTLNGTNADININRGSSSNHALINFKTGGSLGAAIGTSSTGATLYFWQQEDTTASKVFSFEPSTNIYELTASSGTQTFMNIACEIAQSGTAGYNGLLLNVTETTTGSGAKNLMDLQVGGSSKFKVSNAGQTTLAGGQVFYSNGNSTIGGNNHTTTLGSLTAVSYTTSGLNSRFYLKANNGVGDLELALRYGWDQAMFLLYGTNSSKNLVMHDTFADMGHSAATDFTLWIHSHSGAGKSISFRHDDTDGVIETEAGDLKLAPATDVVSFGTHSSIGAETVTGYITVKDSSGNTRKLAVVS